MKKPLSLILAVILLLGIIGCSPQESSLETYHVATETTGVTENTEPPESTEPATDPKEITQPTEPSEVTESTQSTEATEATEPPTEATEPPTEPAGCQHDWKCIHHAEEGHWRAGIVCDCGWTVYGDPGELVAKWNAHSASYPATESLFDHGGYGSADEWIVDKPAYDEWVCRHCGEPKE